MKPPCICNRSSRTAAFYCVLLFLSGCGQKGDQGGTGAAVDPLLSKLTNPALSQDDRIAGILAEARPANAPAITALLRLMKDRSQAAFVLASDPDHALGYRAQELEEKGKDVRSNERVAAICALEKIGGYRALPDLLLALDDRNPVVACHAARALVRLGNRSGLLVLVNHLGGRAVASETANRILIEVSGKDLGFITDAPHVVKQKSIAAWQGWLRDQESSGATLPLEGRPYQQGQDSETDRRIAFFVEMLGQFQFLFHEQVRTALSRMGPTVLSFLRQAVEGAATRTAAGGWGPDTLQAGVAQVLGEIDHANASVLLKQLMEDDHPTVRARAVRAFGGHGSATAARAVAPALKDQDDEVRAAALETLGRIGGNACIPVLEQFDAGTDPAWRRLKTLALFEATRGKESKEEVLALLLSDRFVDRNQAHAVLVRVTKEDGGFDPNGDLAARQRAVAQYRVLLER